ncbi:hypothetical protein N9L92_02285 [Saprospiraceae bacterium]|nr:hypothetical protein [Saprospiraceae bacterium]
MNLRFKFKSLARTNRFSKSIRFDYSLNGNSYNKLAAGTPPTTKAVDLGKH